MGGSSRCREALRLLGIGLVLVAGVRVEAGPADKQAPRLAPRVRLRDGFAAAAVRVALEGADRRLASAECREVLSDFADDSGQTLRANLATLGETAREHLARLLFYDGTSQPRCAVRGIGAVTTPGSLVVFICDHQFASNLRHDRRQNELLLIHEMLHTLGLGENPPSSADINARVSARCAP